MAEPKIELHKRKIRNGLRKQKLLIAKEKEAMWLKLSTEYKSQANSTVDWSTQAYFCSFGNKNAVINFNVTA
jgi:hypothetical protein